MNISEFQRKKEVRILIESIKKIAIEYYQLTGRPLGVTGEVAEFEAAEILNLELKEWDKIILVLLDKEYKPFEIYEAYRSEIVKEIKRPGSKARNLKGMLGISKFKAIGTLIWLNNS